MYPESMAPALSHYDEFKEFMDERNLVARRDYVDAGPDTRKIREYDDDTPAHEPGFWTVVIYRETRMQDGRLWVRMVDVGEHAVVRGWKEQWQGLADLFELAWERDGEENGFAVD